MKISYKSLYNNVAFLFVVSMLFFKPPIFDHYPALSKLNLLLSLARGAVCAFIIFLSFYCQKMRFKKNSGIIPIFIFLMWLIICTFLGHEDVKHIGLTALYIFAFAIFIKDGLIYNENAILKVLFWVLLSLNAINLLLFIALPNGIMMSNYYSNKIHFLGQKNGFAAYIMPLIVMSFINYNRKNIKKINCLTAIAISIVSCIMSDSSTSIVSLFVMLVLIITSKEHRFSFKKYRKYIIVLVLVSFGFVFFRIQNYFSFILEGVFGKSADLTNRTFIWDAAIELFKKNPILGYGVNTYTGNILIKNTYYYSHNLILELLVSSGIIGLLLYLNIFRVSIKNYAISIKNDETTTKSKKWLYDKKIAIFCMIAFFITAIAEAPIYKLYIYLCLMIINHKIRE